MNNPPNSKGKTPATVLAVMIMVAASFMYGRPVLAGSDDTYKSLQLFSEVLEELENNYVDEIDPRELIRNAVKGMVGNLDPHSSFMPPEAFDELKTDTKGEFSGIGIVITMKEGILTVISPIEGTPAYKAGVMAGDIIIKINGDSTRDMALWEAVKRMRGPRFKEVDITVIRENEESPLTFTLKRDLIPLNSVRSSTLSPGYGYLRITNFRENTAKDLEKALDSMESDGGSLKGLIMDLRDNPGGLLDQAVRVSDLFLEKGDIVSIKGRLKKNTQVFSAKTDPDDRRYPMVVLINGGSASASEIVAGAMQDHARALILGTGSFGKGSVQTLRPLKEGSGIKYTIARYYTPNGRSIQAKGIIPDIRVEHEILKKKKENISEFDRMLKEKDLKNRLDPEGDPAEKTKKDRKRELMDSKQLKRDLQIKRALDILISYDIFSRVNGS